MLCLFCGDSELSAVAAAAPTAGQLLIGGTSSVLGPQKHNGIEAVEWKSVQPLLAQMETTNGTITALSCRQLPAETTPVICRASGVMWRTIPIRMQPTDSHTLAHTHTDKWRHILVVTVNLRALCLLSLFLYLHASVANNPLYPRHGGIVKYL